MRPVRSGADMDPIDSPDAQRGPLLMTAAASQHESDSPSAGDGRQTHGVFWRWDSRARRAALVMLAGLSVVIGWWWFSGQPQDVTPVAVEVRDGDTVTGSVTEAVSAPVGTVLVHVVGKVAEPGVVELPAGARVFDAIEAAGGATKDKALQSVNLARIVVDGEQIVVGTTDGQVGNSRISLNSSDARQLEQIPGVGPVIAERIVQWRTENGPFRSVEELAEVSGIGPALVDRIKDEVGM